MEEREGFTGSAFHQQTFGFVEKGTLLSGPSGYLSKLQTNGILLCFRVIVVAVSAIVFSSQNEGGSGVHGGSDRQCCVVAFVKLLSQ